MMAHSTASYIWELLGLIELVIVIATHIRGTKFVSTTFHIRQAQFGHQKA